MRRCLVILAALACAATARARQERPEPPPEPTLEQRMEALQRKLEHLERELAARPPAPPSPEAAPASIPSSVPYLDPLGRVTPDQLHEGSDAQLKFLGYFFTKGEANNIAPENDTLQGRLVGRLYGTNTTRTGGASVYAEQRFIPFVIFEPRILDGFARLRMSFEINWTWGDSSYGAGGNFGAALSGRSVNLQTQNVHVELKLWRRWHAVVGLQRLWDNPRDPYRTFFSTMALTGNRLAFWGTDAVGVAVHGIERGQLFRLGAYSLYSNKINADDDVLLFELLTARDLGRSFTIGASARYLRDTSSGQGGVSVVGQGPASRLADYNGVFRFPLGNATYHAHVAWLGIDFAYNPELAAGRWGASAFVVGNFGRINAAEMGPLQKAADIAGVAVNGRLAYRWGSSKTSHVAGEVIVTSGDSNGINDQLYTGVLTGNTWGAPAGIYISHGAYLLLPHSNVVNRLTTAVFDISNVGYGLVAGTFNFSADLYRNLLTLKVGAAAGLSPVAPQGGGSFIGVEGNAALVYRPKVFFSIEAHGAYLGLGSFFDSPAIVTSQQGRPPDPWMAQLNLKWLMF